MRPLSEFSTRRVARSKKKKNKPNRGIELCVPTTTADAQTIARGDLCRSCSSCPPSDKVTAQPRLLGTLLRTLVGKVRSSPKNWTTSEDTFHRKTLPLRGRSAVDQIRIVLGNAKVIDPLNTLGRFQLLRLACGSITKQCAGVDL